MTSPKKLVLILVDGMTDRSSRPHVSPSKTPPKRVRRIVALRWRERLGPVQIAEYFRPYYRAIWEPLAERGAKIFQMDTDGNINPVISALLDCGVNCIYPMEPAAGMDIVQVRQQAFHVLGGEQTA